MAGYKKTANTKERWIKSMMTITDCYLGFEKSVRPVRPSYQQ